MQTKKKSFHENFVRFLDNPTRKTLSSFLNEHHGENSMCEFKREWPEGPSLAKHILGIANTTGGAIIIGVSEDKSGIAIPGGLDNILDKSEIRNRIKKYIPEKLSHYIDCVDITLNDSTYQKLNGKSFQILFVEHNPKLIPFISRGSGKGIRENAIYIRKEGSTEECGHDDLQEILNKRIETGHSTRKEIDINTHLHQLQTLYHAHDKSMFGSFTMINQGKSYRKYISNLLELKKKTIEKDLGIIDS